MFSAGPPAVGFESVHPHSAGRAYPTRYTLGGGDQLVRLGEMDAHPYEVETGRLGDLGDGAAWWPAWPWPTAVWVALLAGAVAGAGVAYWLATAE